jgi:hypothetical protein
MNRCPVQADEHRYQLEQEQLQREAELKLKDAARIQNICFSDAPSLEEALREEGDEALATALLLLRAAPNHATAKCVNTAVEDCVKRYAEKLVEAKFESGAYASDLPF